MQLKVLQQGFLDYFENNNTPAAKNFLACVESSVTLSAEKRCQIYASSITASHINALEETFPVTLRLVGMEFFAELAKVYVRRFPSRSPDLADLGEHFSEFLSDFPHVQTLPYLSEVADLEWCWHRAFNGPDEKQFNVKSLEAVTDDAQGNIQFILQKNAHLIDAKYPVLKIWETNQEDYTGDEIIDIQSGGGFYIVWRQGLATRIDVLDDDEFALLSAFDNQLTIADVCTNHPDIDISMQLPKAFARGFIADFSLQRG